MLVTTKRFIIKDAAAGTAGEAPAGAGAAGTTPAAAAPAAAAPAADPNRASFPSHTPAATPAPAQVDFASLIPAEYKDKQWVKDSVKDIPTLFKRVEDLQSELGKRPSGIPAEDAKPEEWAKFNKTFGVPDKPEEYEFSAPPEGLENDTEFQTSVQKIMKDAGISKRQFKLIEPAWNAMMLQMAKKTQAGAQALDKEFDKLAVATFGERKEKALANAKAMIDKFTPDSVKPHVGNLSNENLIIIAGVLDKIIETYVSEDQLPNGKGPTGGPQGEDAVREEARKLMLTPAYQNEFHPDHAAVSEKVRALYDRIKK